MEVRFPYLEEKSYDVARPIALGRYSKDLSADNAYVVSKPSFNDVIFTKNVVDRSQDKRDDNKGNIRLNQF
jgi:3'-phosphoadenosine 5'-phosphosulfate sulfotransferase